MGYANPSQITGGIHLRIYSRAFIFSHRSNPEKRVVFVSVDCGMQGQGVTAQVCNLHQYEWHYNTDTSDTACF